jgi:3-hydroxyisobutyrate dehydrogenase-like beta-hydroxyacid dehydrogenase
MNKDLTIALEASAELDFPLTVGSVVVRMWQEAINHGLSNKDHTEFFAVLEKMTSSHETREWPRR